MKKIIIIGASEGIGRELTKFYAEHHYTVGVTARREELLEQLNKELGGQIFTMQKNMLM